MEPASDWSPLPYDPITDLSLFNTNTKGPPLVPRMAETAERVLGVARRRGLYATGEGGEDRNACWPPAVWAAMEVRDVGTHGGGDSEVLDLSHVHTHARMCVNVYVHVYFDIEV